MPAEHLRRSIAKVRGSGACISEARLQRNYRAVMREARGGGDAAGGYNNKSRHFRQNLFDNVKIPSRPSESFSFYRKESRGVKSPCDCYERRADVKIDASRVIRIFDIIIGGDECVDFVSTLHQPTRFTRKLALRS